MEPSLCCLLYKALSLDPVPVIENMIYIPGAEGLDLTTLEAKTVTPCPVHKFNFKHAAALLLRHASRNKQGSCCCSTVQRKQMTEATAVSPLMNEVPAKAPLGGGKIKKRQKGPGCTSRNLWAYEIDIVVKAYRWLMNNRTREYPKCCDAVIVCQLERAQCLPPGLYVYRTRPLHFGCTVERPLTVVDQFNFMDPSEQSLLPSTITIELFPGRDNFSAMYVIARKLPMTPEYSNRIFGEATALGMVESYSPINATVCEHHEVAVRSERACVIDLRWKGFDTKTSCFKAIPKVGGLQAVVWSNHCADVQEIECKVLAWIFGLSNQLPKEVQMIDYKHEALGIRYILMDMDTFPEGLPEPPRKDVSVFLHTHFVGDLALATRAIGDVSGTRTRMGSPSPETAGAFAFWYTIPTMGPCQPTPFSCGVRCECASLTETFKKSLVEWTLKKDGTECLALAVQHTLYYNAVEMKYKMMVSHTVRENDNTLNIFRL